MKTFKEFVTEAVKTTDDNPLVSAYRDSDSEGAPTTHANLSTVMKLHKEIRGSQSDIAKKLLANPKKRLKFGSVGLELSSHHEKAKKEGR